jgi:hypothetical protein
MSDGSPPESSGGPELTVVVPVHRPDHDRLARLLLPSLLHNLAGPYDIFVIATDGCAAEVRERTSGLPVRVADGAQVLPALGRLGSPRGRAALLVVAAMHAALRRAGIGSRYSPRYAERGWFQQQALKLAFAEIVDTRFYLAVDADMICVRPTHIDELVVEGKAPIEHFDRIPPEQVPWYRWAAELLGVEPPPVAMAMSPFIFATDLVRDLLDRWQAAPRARLARAGHQLVYGRPRGQTDIWLSLLPWTEYALYHTHLVSTQSTVDYYRHSSDLVLLGNALWHAEERAAWSAVSSIEQMTPHVFTLVQPSAGIPVAELEATFEPILRPAPGRTER